MAAIHMNRAAFEQALQDNELVLMDFWAPWCPDCVRITEAYDQIAQEFEGRMVVGKVNIDDEKELFKEQGGRRIPTLILYQNGKALGNIVEPPSKAVIDDFISQVMPKKEEPKAVSEHEMVIIGGGPAGYTAALYAARAGIDAVVLEKLSAGGQMALTHQIDNYPGFEDGVDGFTLAAKMQQQAERFGAKSVNAEVIRLDLKAEPKVIETSEGVFCAKTVVLAMGANPRELGVAEEREMIGRGVGYCAACDGMFYRGKTVVVVGGGNSAAADALLLSRIAQKVIVVHRRDTLRATKVYHKPLMSAENVEFRWNSVVTELVHGDVLQGIRIKDVKTGEESEVACSGLFVSVGRKPASELLKGQLELDEYGYVLADETTRTSIPGVYVVGDLRAKPMRQIVTAVADGATAVHMAEEYLAEKE
ncbi:MAG: thioredoxin-disulfide reductase [Clostridia bacterium]|nr:thioredoxin-disulfide reductase [Clostridia bacterium]